MIKKRYAFLAACCISGTLLLISCGGPVAKEKVTNGSTTAAASGNDTLAIANLLDTFNATAGRADFQRYFDCLTADAIFTGTDATERWTKAQFQAYAKPFFERGKAWNFTAIDRHITLGKDSSVAWFDELLSTQMKICRGSGVAIKQNGNWKISQYILSATIPNGLMDSVVSMKAPIEELLIKEITQPPLPDSLRHPVPGRY